MENLEFEKLKEQIIRILVHKRTYRKNKGLSHDSLLQRFVNSKDKKLFGKAIRELVKEELVNATKSKKEKKTYSLFPQKRQLYKRYWL